MADRKLSLSVKFLGGGNLQGILRGLTGAGGGAQAALSKLNKEAKIQRDELKAVREEMGKAGVATRQMFEREKALEAQLEKTNHDLKLRRGLMAKQAGADARGSNARSAGTGNLVAAGSIAAPLLLAAKAGSDFQSGMVDIRQNANLSAEATAKLQKGLVKAAADAKLLPEEVRQGAAYLIASGLSVEKTSGAIGAVSRAASAYRAEMLDVSKATFAVADNLKVPAEQAGKALDIMAFAAKNGQIDMKEMAIVFPVLTAQAQALKQTGPRAVADLSAALEIARKGTDSAEKAGNNLNNLMAKINSKETVEKFKKEFGVDLPAALKRAYAEGKTPIEAIAEITNKTLGGDLGKLSYLFQDSEVQQALRPLIQNLGLYRQLRADALAANGVVEADFALRAQTADANTKALQGSLSMLSLTIADKVLPHITTLVDKTTLIISAAAEWADKHPGLTNVIVGTVAAVAGLNLVLGAGRIIYGSIVGPLTMAANAYTWLTTSSKAAAVVGGISQAMAVGWGALTAAAAPYVTAMVSAAAATWAVAWPVLAVIAAGVALTAVIMGIVWAFRNFDKVKAWVAGAMDKVTNYLKSIDWLKLGADMLKGLAFGLIGGIPGLLMAITKVAMDSVGHFRKLLGIKSPSRVFHGFGGNISKGLALGIDDKSNVPIKKAAGLAAGVAGAFALAATGPAFGGASPGYGDGMSGMGAVTINVYAAPGQNAQDIAAAVRAELERVAHSKAAATRSSYRDED